MCEDDDEEIPLESSDPETQFIPQDDDELTLWEVIEITAEKGRQYKVRWKGIDPKTQKPWPHSWVAKHDCTHDLVTQWKLKQAKKKKKTTKSRASGVTSTATESTRRSISTTTAVTPRRGRPKATIPTSSIHKTSTRSRQPIDIRSISPLSSLPASSPIEPPVVSSLPAKRTGTKRKHGETASTTTSSRIASSSISGSVRKKRKLEVEIVNNYEHPASPEVDDVDMQRNGRSRAIESDEDDDVGVKTETDDVSELDPQHSKPHSQVSTSHSQLEEEEEADERMVEESLSDIYYSPRPSSPPELGHNQEDQEQEDTPTPPARVQTPTRRRQETPEESTPTASTEKRLDSLPADLAKTTSKPDPPSKKSTRPSASSSSSPVDPAVSSPSTESHTTTKPHILNQATKPGHNNKRKRSFTPTYPSTVSKQQWKELMDFQSQQITASEIVPEYDKSDKVTSEGDVLNMESIYPVVEELSPPTKSVPGPTSHSRAQSPLSDLLPERVTKPVSLPAKPGPSATSITVPIAPPRDISEEDDYFSPILSPGAQKRLKRFDKAVGLASRKGKEREQQPGDGKVKKKGREREREEEEEGEIAVTRDSGRKENEVVRISEQKKLKGKEKESDKAQGSSTPKPPETEKQAEPLLESEFEEEHGRGKSKSKSLSKEPPNRSSSDHSDVHNSLVHLEHQDRAAEAKSSMKPLVDQGMSSHHHASGSKLVVEPNVKADGGISTKEKTNDIPPQRPTTRSRSRLGDTVEEPEDVVKDKGKIFNATSKPVSKTTSKPPSKPQSKVDTNQAKSLPSTTTTTTIAAAAGTRRSAANPRSNSFVDDVIPETEESQSPDIRYAQGAASHFRVAIPPATPLMKSTVRSRMKLKTPQPKLRPLSRTSSGALALGVKWDMDLYGVDDELDDVTSGEAVKKASSSNKKTNENGTKPFGPIPKISPSVFTPHLSSSLPESIIESTEGDGDEPLKRAAEDDDSIEQFESPMKSMGGERTMRRVGVLAGEEREHQRAKESTSDLWNSDLNRRGRELAEVARKKEKEHLRSEDPSAAPMLITQLPRAKKTALRYDLVREESVDLPEETSDDVSIPSVEGVVAPDGILSPPPPPPDSVVQQMEEAYVDLSGGMSEGGQRGGAAVAGGIEESQSGVEEVEVTEESNKDVEMGQFDHLRQEEEESSQDILMELRLHQARQGLEVSGGDLVPEIKDDAAVHLLPAIQIESSQLIEPAVLDEGAAAKRNESDRPGDEIPNIPVEKPSSASSTCPYPSVQNGDGGRMSPKATTTKFESRSRSHSVSSQKSEKEKEPDLSAVVPATASTNRDSVLQVSSQPTDSQAESVEENPHHLGAAICLLNTKSEEIAKLEIQLSAEQQTNEDLLQQLSALRLHITESTQFATKTLEQELVEARAQLAVQTTRWGEERASLVLDIEKATRGKASAEQDRDFFREQYAKASAFVSSVRDENVELEKRIKIATDQAESGVNLIKSTFELRTKSLEEDVRAWRRMAEFLMEKDRRTNEDEIRRRAAEQPELRTLCDRQESALEESSERLMEMQRSLEATQRMFVEAAEAGKRWKEVTVSLGLELSEAKTKLERVGEVGIVGDDDDEGAQVDGHELVYRCQWRPDASSNDACEAVFIHLSELQEHMYSARHIQRD